MEEPPFVTHTIEQILQCPKLNWCEPSVIMTVKPCIWMSIDDETVALVQGYNVANLSPPVLFLASDAIPSAILDRIKSNPGSKITVSCVTMRERECLNNITSTLLNTFQGWGLTPLCRKGYPPAVSLSPIHMFGHIHSIVDLNEGGKSMILLQLDVITMRHDVLTSQATSNSSDRQVLALLSAEKLQPLACIGPGRYGTVGSDNLFTLLRPSKNKDGMWVSDPFIVKKNPIIQDSMNSYSILPDVLEWITSQPCPLGYDPMKAIVIPRPIGWISTYYKTMGETTTHVAPYSFTMDVAHGDGITNPMIAFAAYRPTDGPLKDVQLDITDNPFFTVSTVTPNSVIPMNLSSAPIPRKESEFDLAGLSAVDAQYVNAPIVEVSPWTLECEHSSTIDVGGFSILVGKVVAIRASRKILNEDGQMDNSKLHSVTRLGYHDEYAVMNQVC
jgi:flavin reductase (DIM6/NTAB) family NADH-FMN oxidoreductase RutF